LDSCSRRSVSPWQRLAYLAISQAFRRTLGCLIQIQREEQRLLVLLLLLVLALVLALLLALAAVQPPKKKALLSQQVPSPALWHTHRNQAADASAPRATGLTPALAPAMPPAVIYIIDLLYIS
jgi:hypothetical protein